MTLITAATWGVCYLLHFSRPLGNLEKARAQAQHYLGWAEDVGDGVGLEQRIAEHLAGRGARITRAAIAQGIELTVVATWVAPLGFEKILKRRKEAPKLCGICSAARGQRRKRAALRPTQLALPLDLAACPGSAGGDLVDPLPAPARLTMDGYEAWMLGRMSAMRGGLAARVVGGEWDEGLL